MKEQNNINNILHIFIFFTNLIWKQLNTKLTSMSWIKIMQTRFHRDIITSNNQEPTIKKEIEIRTHVITKTFGVKIWRLSCCRDMGRSWSWWRFTRTLTEGMNMKDVVAYGGCRGVEGVTRFGVWWLFCCVTSCERFVSGRIKEVCGGMVFYGGEQREFWRCDVELRFVELSGEKFGRWFFEGVVYGECARVEEVLYRCERDEFF